MNADERAKPVTKKDKMLLFTVADSPSQQEYSRRMGELEHSNRKLHEYLTGVPKEHWVQFTFNEDKISTFGERTSNPAEQSNSWLGFDLRSCSPLGVFYMYMDKVYLNS